MAEVIENTEHNVKEMHEIPSNAKVNSALTLGIIGTALSGLGLLGMGGGLLNNLNGKNSNNNANSGSDMCAESNTMTAETLYIERKQCQNFLDTTKQYYEGKLAAEERFANLFFDGYKRDVDNSFMLYKYTRDANDELSKKISDVDKKVDVMAAIRPYQDALIDNKINTNALLAQYALDKRTCRMIEGQLVLPSTPTVTGLGSYNSCCCGTTVASTPTV